MASGRAGVRTQGCARRGAELRVKTRLTCSLLFLCRRRLCSKSLSLMEVATCSSRAVALSGPKMLPSRSFFSCSIVSCCFRRELSIRAAWGRQAFCERESRMKLGQECTCSGCTCLGGWASVLVAEEAVSARRNRQAGGPECQGQSDPLLTRHIPLVTNPEQECCLLRESEISLLPLLPLTVVHSQTCSLGPLQLLTICCLPVAPQIDSARCSQTQTEPV